MYISLLCNWDLCQGWEWWWGVKAAIQLVTVANVERERRFPTLGSLCSPKREASLITIYAKILFGERRREQL